MSNLSSAAASRRESARAADGTFGHQHHAESAVSLSAGQDGPGPAEWSPFEHAPGSLHELWPTKRQDFDGLTFVIPERDRQRVATEFGLTFTPERLSVETEYGAVNATELYFTRIGLESRDSKTVQIDGPPHQIMAATAARCAPHPSPESVLEAAGGLPVHGWTERGDRHVITGPADLPKHRIVLASHADAVAKVPARAWSHGDTGWSWEDRKTQMGASLLAASHRLRQTRESWPTRFSIARDELDGNRVRFLANTEHQIVGGDRHQSDSSIVQVDVRDLADPEETNRLARKANWIHAEVTHPHTDVEGALAREPEYPDDARLRQMADDLRQEYLDRCRRSIGEETPYYRTIETVVPDTQQLVDIFTEARAGFCRNL